MMRVLDLPHFVLLRLELLAEGGNDRVAAVLDRAGDDVGALVGVADDLLAQLLRLEQRAADGLLLVTDFVKVGHDDFQLALQLVVFAVKLRIFIDQKLNVIVHLGGAVPLERLGKRLAFEFMRCEHSYIHRFRCAKAASFRDSINQS